MTFEKIVSLVRKQKPTPEDRLNAQHLYNFIAMTT